LQARFVVMLDDANLLQYLGRGEAVFLGVGEQRIQCFP